MTTDDLNRRVGVWSALGRLGDYRLKEVLWPEGLFAAIIGGGGAVAVVRVTDLADRTAAMGALLPLAGALLAVVFAALAIVVSLPSTSYLRMLGDTPDGGMARFLDPFLVAVGTQIFIVLLALGYGLAAEAVAWQIEHAAFYVAGFALLYGLLDIAALARQLVRHGILRASDAAMNAQADDTERSAIRQLHGRRK